MLPQLSAAVRVFLCTRPTDMRKGFDGLSGLVQECFGQDLLPAISSSSSTAAGIASRSSTLTVTGW